MLLGQFGQQLLKLNVLSDGFLVIVLEVFYLLKETGVESIQLLPQLWELQKTLLKVL